MNQLYTIIGLFALGAILGIYLLSFVLKSKETPKGIAFIHGAFVAIALIMLISYVSKEEHGPVEAMVLLILAALGGFVLIYRDLTAKPLPKWLALTHGLLAVAGFTLLLVHALG